MHKVTSSRSLRLAMALIVASSVLPLPTVGAQTPPPPPQGAPPPPPAGQQAATPFQPEELEQIAAPVALYPDPLLAQIFMASTYPLEVVQAARFAKQNASA